MNSLVTRYVAEAPEEQRKIMEALRSILHEEVPGLAENYKWSRPVFSAGTDFAYFQSNKSYLNFGFYNAGKIQSHRELLEGTGKEMRHFKIRHQEDLNPDIIRNWIREITK